MFYFLLFTGTALILYGIMGIIKERDLGRQPFLQVEHTSEDAVSRVRTREEDQESVRDLTDRMAEMEKSLFDHLLKWQMEKKELLEKMETGSASTEKQSTEDVSSDLIMEEVRKVPDEILEEKIEEQEEPSKKKPMPENIRRVLDYEEEGLSVQEIANITRMKKGEVLLLRNLSKHYRK
ncbi:hypothetical protein ACHAL6_02005 [Proteiniclasticum sp. C24MP]|uniref:hypothetical protein n=1 Tax=Proteiniclasticum sp. C24MP TaxID=3374101 RepID=UPI0037545089